mmetsp:Transcript_17356/g.40293  ORF Transcript_17356/g.40293 Transcript_17356/m.40293 type:complete len:84 (-) Transcript_17356:1968-2219(-)
MEPVGHMICRESRGSERDKAKEANINDPPQSKGKKKMWQEGKLRGWRERNTAQFPRLSAEAATTPTTSLNINLVPQSLYWSFL